MRIVVTGRNGQVAQSLVEHCARCPGVDVITVGRPDFDLRWPESVEQVIAAARPDVVVSAAAYTAVDAAEDDVDTARMINVTGAEAVARAASLCGASMIHISTDYVFSGDFEGRYREDMKTTPRNVYGRTKLGGEKAVRAANPQSLILRSGWIYSPFGGNFVKTMLRLAGERDTLQVVDDQIGNPTSSMDIADAIIRIARVFRPGDGRAGIYHYGGAGDVTWCGLARQVLTESAALGGPRVLVRPITTAQYPSRAIRPRNTRLDTSKIADVFGIHAIDWRAGVATAVQRLLENVSETRVTA